VARLVLAMLYLMHLMSLKQQMRSFHDQLRWRPSSLFMLFMCSSISVASLAMMWPPSSNWLPGPRTILTLLPHCYVQCSALTNWFLYQKLIPCTRLTFALMTEAEPTSEKLVNLYQTTWCYNQKTATFVNTIPGHTYKTEYESVHNLK
jgi:hypothetical protein